MLGIVLLYDPALCLGQLATSGPDISLSAGGDGQSDQPQGGSSAHMLEGVPAYIWYNGCGPTSMGMMIGYWDAHGYDNLIPGSNYWASNQTAIKDVIASPGHIRDYVPTLDRVATPDAPYHADDCLADFDGCSRDPLQWGWSYLNMQSVGLANYMSYCGYTGSHAGYGTWGSAWYLLTTQIDKGQPVQIMVDSNADGTVDHFVTGIGYDTVNGVRQFACYDTWHLNVYWYDLAPVAAGVSFGVYAVTYLNPPALPEPTMLMPLVMLVTLWRRRCVTKQPREMDATRTSNVQH